PGYQRHVEVARLPYRLAVVERFEHRQQAPVLLHVARQRIEVLRSGVGLQGAPGRQGPLGGCYRPLDVTFSALGDLRQLAGITRVIGREGAPCTTTALRLAE